MRQYKLLVFLRAISPLFVVLALFVGCTCTTYHPHSCPPLGGSKCVVTVCSHFYPDLRPDDSVKPFHIWEKPSLNAYNHRLITKDVNPLEVIIRKYKSTATDTNELDPGKWFNVFVKEYRKKLYFGEYRDKYDPRSWDASYRDSLEAGYSYIIVFPFSDTVVMDSLYDLQFKMREVYSGCTDDYQVENTCLMWEIGIRRE